MDVQTEADALVEGRHGLPCAVDVAGLLGLHVAFLMVDSRFDDPVSDSLSTHLAKVT